MQLTTVCSQQCRHAAVNARGLARTLISESALMGVTRVITLAQLNDNRNVKVESSEREIKKGNINDNR